LRTSKDNSSRAAFFAFKLGLLKKMLLLLILCEHAHARTHARTEEHTHTYTYTYTYTYAYGIRNTTDRTLIKLEHI